MFVPKQQTSRDQAWLDAGLAILRSDGDDGLTIEALCVAMAKTKGAFYHHFAGREDYVARLLAHWERTFTGRVIEDLEPLDGPRARLRALADRTVREVDSKVERAIRFWSEREMAARVVLKRVDHAREQYLREQFEAATGDAEHAEVAARAHLAILVGSQMLYQDLPRSALAAISAFVDFLGLDCPPNQEERS